MKLILSSAGLVDHEVVAEFLIMLDKDPSLVHVAFVPTASRTVEEKKFVQESYDELVSLGIQKNNILTLDLNHKIKDTELSGVDVVYVCGGNTFYLLSQIKKTGFGWILKKFLQNGGLYFGVSAGSIVVGPSIEIASVGKDSDQNDIALKDLGGLKFVDIMIFPHYNSRRNREEIEVFQKKAKHAIIPLTDEQAFLVSGKKQKIVGG